MTRTRPRTAWLLHGMKRSGNHALVNWLLPQLRCAFVNNAIPLGPILRGHPFPATPPFAEWWRRVEPGAMESDTVLVTLEDHDLSVMPFEPEVVDVRRLLLVRMPEQLFSSRLRKAGRVDMPAYPRGDGPVMQRAVSLWKQHARCWLGEEHASYGDCTPILFEAWFADPDYRRAVSARLGVAFDDSGFGKVTGEGGGSSFDGIGFDGRAHLMNVADRVSQLDPRERGVLDALFADPELRRLAKAMKAADPYRTLPSGRVG